MLRPIQLTAVFALTSVAIDAQAAILVVDCAAGPYPTIQSAIDVASDGDTIAVRPCGTPYSGMVDIDGMTDLRLIAADTSIANGAFKAGIGPSNAPSVRIDGTSVAHCLQITDSLRVSVTGFHIANCGSAGMWVSTSTDIVVHGNWFSNTGSIAAYAEWGSVATVFSGNRVAHGHRGIYVDGGTDNMRIVDNVFISNQSDGMMFYGTGSVSITNNAILDNGGLGITIGGGAGHVERNRVIDNNGGNLHFGTLCSPCSAVGNEVDGSIVDDSVAADLMDNL